MGFGPREAESFLVPPGPSRNLVHSPPGGVVVTQRNSANSTDAQETTVDTNPRNVSSRVKAASGAVSTVDHGFDPSEGDADVEDNDNHEVPNVSVLLPVTGRDLDDEEIVRGIHRMTVRAIGNVDDTTSGLNTDDSGADNGDGDDDNDDDGSIVPLYPGLNQQRQPDASKHALSARDPFVDIFDPAHDTVASDIRKLKMINAIKSNQAVLSTNNNTKTTVSALGATTTGDGAGTRVSPPPVRVNLSDIYPHIGLIFPVAYSQIGTSRANGDRDNGLSARALIESMQVQARVYEEWIEVMSDYSTVFSHNDREASSGTAAGGLGGGSSGRNNAAKTMKVDGGEDDAQGNGTVYRGGSRSLHYRVKSSRGEVYNIVTDVFNNMLPSWEELPAGLGLGVSWNILWTWSKPRINMTHLLVWQKVNHFHDSKQLTRKDLLKKNLQRYIDLSNTTFKSVNSKTTNNSSNSSSSSNAGGNGNGANIDFEIMPQTFLLPHEYTLFVSAFTAIESVKEKEKLQNYWIMKPVGLSRGRGIELIKDLSEVTYSQSTVVQRYVERPLCLSGYKFDLRLYVLVTSFKPLEAFIYRDGFARVSTHAYSTDPASMSDKFIHLTNSSIQKLNTTGPTSDNPLRDRQTAAAAAAAGGGSTGRRRAGAAGKKSTQGRSSKGGSDNDDDEEVDGDGDDGGDDRYDSDAGGSKISLLGPNGLWKRLEAHGINTEELWQSISALIVKSLVVVDEKMVHQPCCFEVFGYDVLIDSDLRPWLLEVNASPSLARENHLDVKVKNAMIRDIFLLLDPAPYDRAAVVRVLKKRLNGLAKGASTATSVRQGKNSDRGGSSQGTVGDPELEKDLRDILGDYVPRRYGETPGNMGQYEMLCPGTKIYTQVLKMKRKIIKS